MKVAVLGAGAGGQALSGHLSLRGHEVTIFNRRHPVEDAEILAPLKARMAVRLEGELTGVASLADVTNDISEAVYGKDVIVVTMPAVGHEAIAEAMSPFLSAGQMVIVHPGQIGSSWRMAKILRSAAREIKFVVTHTLMYACRVLEAGHIRIHGLKRALHCAALPASATHSLMPMIREVIPQALTSASVLEAEISNINTVVHPSITLCNSTLIETGKPFEFYREGATDGAARLIGALDRERCQVGKALGLNPLTVQEFLAEGYGVPRGSIGEMARNNPGFAGIPAPAKLDHRYVWEDVTCGLMPLAELGKAIGVESPMVESVIRTLRAVINYEIGSDRTASWLGIEGLTREQLREMVQR